MRLHVLSSGDLYRPILMLSEYQSAEVDLLCAACRDLAAGRIDLFSLHEQSWVNATDNCRFIWRYCEKDLGVRLPLYGGPYLLQYSEDAWLEVEGKLSAMRDATPGSLNDLTMEGEV